MAAEARVLRKSGKRSSQLREEGNKAYLAGKNAQVILYSSHYPTQYLQALKLYTHSVRFAPYTGEGVGEELGLGLANRSAVLAQHKEFR